jgi:hypothetical protein
VTKCKLCDQYYGPYSMEIHLKNDHTDVVNREDMQEINRSFYSEGYIDGLEDRERRDEF